MTTDRRFCRFARTIPEHGYGAVYTTEIPEGGLCLSSFLIVTEGGGRVLMGHLNPRAPWDDMGALDAERVRVHSKGWMLPSSHLMLFESPQEAAQRVLKEQLGMQNIKLSDPMVVAEVGTPKRFPSLPKHWDFEFIFRGKAPSGSPPEHEAWSELRYIDLKQTPRQEIARSHDEVLENAGFRF
jgi:ADP-ribose pyrophosphatase YjhB (NUDIX family)